VIATAVIKKAAPGTTLMEILLAAGRKCFMATNNPLTIHVDLEWIDRPEVKELIADGHFVSVALQPDLVLSTKAWNWNDALWPYLPIALKAARKDKPKGVKKDGKQRKSSNRKNSDGTGKVGRRRRTVRDNDVQAASGESSVDKA